MIQRFVAQIMTLDLSCAQTNKVLAKPFNGLFDYTKPDQDDAFGFHLVGCSMKQRLIVVMMQLKGSRHNKMTRNLSCRQAFVVRESVLC
jgi:hypothetical protein